MRTNIITIIEWNRRWGRRELSIDEHASRYASSNGQLAPWAPNGHDDPGSSTRHRAGGAKVYSDAKNGVDVGTIVGHPIGVTATTDTAEILALDADLVLYAPSFTDLDDVCALLASGKNVEHRLSCFTQGAFRRTIAYVCRQPATRATAPSTAADSTRQPLWRVPLALSGMSRTIDQITLQERADWTLWESTEITFDGMWFGRPTDEVTPTANPYLSFLTRSSSNKTWFLSDTLNGNIDDVSVDLETVPATKDLQVFDRSSRPVLPPVSDGTSADTAMARH